MAWFIMQPPPDCRGLLTEPFHQPSIYHPQLPPFRQLGRCYELLLDAFSLPRELQETAFRSAIVLLLTQVFHVTRQSAVQAAGANPVIQELLAYLNAHITESIPLEQLAQRCFVSKNHLNVLFRRATGTTIHQYIRLKRIALVQERMQAGLPAGQAAEQAGFGDYSSFYRAFRAQYGCAPTAQFVLPFGR